MGRSSSRNRAELRRALTRADADGLSGTGKARGYLRTIRIGHGEYGTRMELAYPVRDDRPGCVNVLCGLNNAGKTYILRNLRKVLDLGSRGEAAAKHNVVDVDITVGDDGTRLLFPTVMSFTKTAIAKGNAGRIDIGVSHQKQMLPRDFPSYRRNFLLFFLTQLAEHVPSVRKISFDTWLDSKESRLAALSDLEIEDVAYRCAQTDSLVQDLQALLGGTLYFRRIPSGAARKKKAIHDEEGGEGDGRVELVLAYSDQQDPRTVSFDEWSEGQQVLFYIVVQIALAPASVVLLDEIENHLHPQYITKLIEILRRRVRQTLIATHHPHVIFSEYVDRVFFLERKHVKPLESPPQTLRHLKGQWQPRVVRVVHTLRDNFDRVTAAYKLFDHQDNQLLRQAAWISDRASLVLYNAIAESLSPDIAVPNAKGRLDKQSSQLAREISAATNHGQRKEPIRILDFGAGLGRSLVEVSKAVPWRTGSVLWTCWEANEETRVELRSLLASVGLQATVPDHVNAIADQSADLCVICNVLHEVTPRRAAQLLFDAVRKTNQSQGAFVVMELYPLLHAEKFAVPYPAELLRGLFVDCGLNVRLHILSVQGGATMAYCIVVTSPFGIDNFQPVQVEGRIVKIWENIEKASLAEYASRSNVVHGVEDYLVHLQGLTTIASIAAWRHQRWQ